MSELQSLRKKIDAIDRDLVDQLNERARLVQKIGVWKSQNQSPIHDPQREAQVLTNIRTQNKGPLSNELVLGLYEDVVRRFRQWEESQLMTPSETFKLLPKNRILILGLGLMGSSCALALRKRFPELLIYGIDPTTPSAPVLEALTHFQGRLEEASEKAPPLEFFDVVILAMPIQIMIAFLRDQGSQLKTGALVIDLGSTKSALCQAAVEYLPTGVEHLGLHPMVGKAGGGSRAASADLYFQQPILITLTKPLSPTWAPWPQEFIEALGGKSLEVSAEIHDRILAVTSHLPQFLSTALALTARDFLKGMSSPIFGPAFKDLTRLASSEFPMWKDIAITNSKNILETMDLFRTKLELLRTRISSGEFEKEFRQAKEFRTQMMADHVVPERQKRPIKKGPKQNNPKGVKSC